MPRQRSVLEDSESNMPDQVVSAVEYGMEQTKKLCKEILPLCDPGKKIADNLAFVYTQGSLCM